MELSSVFDIPHTTRDSSTAIVLWLIKALLRTRDFTLSPLEGPYMLPTASTLSVTATMPPQGNGIQMPMTPKTPNHHPISTNTINPNTDNTNTEAGFLEISQLHELELRISSGTRSHSPQ